MCAVQHDRRSAGWHGKMRLLQREGPHSTESRLPVGVFDPTTRGADAVRRPLVVENKQKGRGVLPALSGFDRVGRFDQVRGAGTGTGTGVGSRGRFATGVIGYPFGSRLRYRVMLVNRATTTRPRRNPAARTGLVRRCHTSHRAGSPRPAGRGQRGSTLFVCAVAPRTRRSAVLGKNECGCRDESKGRQEQPGRGTHELSPSPIRSCETPRRGARHSR